MSHHDTPETVEYNEELADANSRADLLAIVSLVAIVIVMAVFFVSR
ncbi:MAG: hypothetical protein ACSHXZ_07360 [Gammaproteobacteria bacterium]|mgnify:CR=1 FL=1